MAPKTKKSAAPKEVNESASPARARRGIMGDQPWEEYSDGSGSSPEEGLGGITEMAEPGETEVLISMIEDAGKGKFKVTHPRIPGDRMSGAPLREDKMLAIRKKDHKLGEKDAPLREDAFSTGSEEGGRVVFSADAFYYILLTDDMKYRAMQQSYKYYREDPVYRGLVNSLTNYVIGGGLKFDASDENPDVNEYIKKFWVDNKMDGKDREIVIRWFLTGEIALRLYRKGATGITAKQMAVRMIPFWRLAEVLKDDQDAEVTTGFRVWQSSGPYRPQVKEEEITADEMLYWKNSTPEEDRGEPPLLATMRPCKWYQDWINNRVILNRYRTAIVLFKKIIKGTPGAVSRVQGAEPAAAQHTGVGGKLEKRLPKFGTMITHNDKVEYDWKSPQLGASDAGEDGRKIILYICAAAQTPEFLLGDASNANLANIFVAESPFIRQIEAHQHYFKNFFSELFRLVIEHGIESGEIPPNSTETKVVEGSKWVGKARQFMKFLGLSEADTDDKGQLKKTKKIPTRTDVAIEWPQILHRDALEEAQTFQLHQAMGLASRQTLRGKAGYDNELEMERLDEEKAQDQDEFEQARQAELDAAADAAGAGDPQEPAPGARQPLKNNAKGAGPGRQGTIGKP